MWPKLIPQLLELLPHVSRLVPMADRFLQSRSGNDEETRNSLDALRVEVSKTLHAHESVYRQMNEQSERIDLAVSEVRTARVALVATEERIAGLENKVASLRVLVAMSFAMTVVLVVMMIVLLVRR
ncbi:hypothetical protein ACFQBQ_14300 [Granulicella cerasi]|uniref:Uncharacterized protein n=1 Tax=Granulicella cerasi TaxID=741063 RepID=A0ABW1ZB77_9BACT|nr:hypothetical protein [Granulicella cerasi]